MIKAKEKFSVVLSIIVFCIFGISILYQTPNTQPIEEAVTLHVKQPPYNTNQVPETFAKRLRDLEFEYAQKRSQIYAERSMALKKTVKVLKVWNEQEMKIRSKETEDSLEEMQIRTAKLDSGEVTDPAHLMQSNLQKDTQRLRQQSQRLQELIQAL